MLIGRLGHDPDLKYTPSGTAIANFNLATNRSVKKDGKWADETDWHKIVAWGKLAQICGEYLAKGSNTYIEGQLITRSWEDKEGNKRQTTEVIAKDIVMLDSKRNRPSTTGEDGLPF
jgi:single-strand DNA-binding protein